MKIALVNPINATVDTPHAIKDLFGLTFQGKIPTDRETSIVELGIALTRTGNKITIFISDHYKPEKTITNHPDLEIIYLPTYLKVIFPPAFIPFIPTLFKYLRQGKFDIILSVDFFQWGTILANFACIGRKTKCYVWQDLNNLPRFPGNFIILLFNNTLGRVTQRIITGFIPKTNSAKRFLIKSGVRNKKILPVIPTGVDSSVFFPEEQCGYNESCQILSVARLHEQKGLKYLIFAMKDVVKEFPEAIALIKGRGPLYEELNALIKSEKLENHVIIDTSFSSRPELVKLYTRSACFVLPSIYETIGFVLLESMSCERPVIACNIDGPNEIVNNRVGFLVEPKNAAALAKCIITILKDRNLQVSMGKTAREIVLKQYDWNVIARRLLEEVFHKNMGN